MSALPRLAPSVALGVGVGGALVDVSSAARLDAGLSYRAGRMSQFDDVDPSTFSFVLDNADGRFTPGNANSTLDTTLSEGAAACMQVDSRLTAGTVRSIRPVFPNADSAWAEVRVTCDDMLGDAARADLGEDIYSAAASQALAYWPLNETADAPWAVDFVGGPRVFRGGCVTFGVDGIDGAASTQVEATVPAGASGTITLNEPGTVIPGGNYPYWYNFWLTPMTSGGYFRFAGADVDFEIQGLSVVYNGSTVATLTQGVPGFFSFYNFSLFELWLDGEQIVSDSLILVPNVGPPVIFIGATGYGDSQFRLSQLSESATRIPGERVLTSTIEERLELIAQAVPEITFDTIPADLSQAPIGPQAPGSGLEAINELMLAEQGYVSTVTTGTLTSPSQKILVRERTRPASVSYTFDVIDELDGAPEFVRDLTNLVAVVRVDGPATSVRVADSTLTSRAGSASTSESVPFIDAVQLRAWGEDRLQRGANTQLRIVSVVIDAMTTPTDRSADLLAAQSGDRLRFTSLPATTLGFDEWDGWLLGREETHDVLGHRFTLHFAPVLPDTAIFDTDRFETDDDFELAADINAVQTTITVDSLTSNAVVLNATDEPYVIQIDDEQIQVDVVGGSFEPQSMNVTRGVNGTTAAAHLAGAQVFTVFGSRFAF